MADTPAAPNPADAPYSAAASLQLLKTTVYFENHPQGEMVKALADQLKKADREISLANSRPLQAEPNMGGRHWTDVTEQNTLHATRFKDGSWRLTRSWIDSNSRQMVTEALGELIPEGDEVICAYTALQEAAIEAIARHLQDTPAHR